MTRDVPFPTGSRRFKGAEMLKVENMSQDEMALLLRRGKLGHLGCSYDNHPYVVPMNYAYDGEYLYFFTTEGTKTDYISANSEVCFQVEEVIDAANWQSVMVFGRAERLSNSDDMAQAMLLISERNPTLTPALSETKIGAWKRFSHIAVYRIHPHSTCGRKVPEAETNPLR